MIAGAEKCLPIRIPDREGKVTKQFLNTRFAPARVSFEYQPAVSDFIRTLVGDLLQRHQFLPVVEADICRYGQALIVSCHREFFAQGFRSGA